MWSFLFISNHLQASGWELASVVLPVPPFCATSVVVYTYTNIHDYVRGR